MRQLLFDVFKVDGNSMFPYLHNNQKVIIKKCSKYKKGDIVVFHRKNTNFFGIKRISAVCDDLVSIKTDMLCINDNSYSLSKYKFINNCRIISGRINKDSYYILGDNFNDSVDSRIFGPIYNDEILGKVIFRIRKFKKDNI